jgi:TP901 family phage tail tape measure protein
VAVRERLELDVSAARAAVQELGGLLEGVAKGFGDTLNQALTQALQGLPIVEVGADASAVTSEIDQAVESGDDLKEVDGDASAVTGEIDSAVEAADDMVEVDADASAVTNAIDDAVGSANTTVELDVDASGLQAGLSDIGEGVKSVNDESMGLNTTLLGSTALMGGLGAKGSSAMAMIANPATGAIAAVGAVGVAAFSAAQDFTQLERALTEVRTLMPGMTDGEFVAMSDAVRALAVEMNIAATDVVPALYQAISSGVPYENVFTFMEVAAQTAIGGVTTLETAVGGLTTIVNAFQLNAEDASVAADSMFQAMKGGRTTIGELSESLFQVAPIASATGVSFQEVNAALATITAVTATPTRRAANFLKAAFAELAQEGSTANEIFRELTDKSFVDFMKGGGTVQQAFRIMSDAANEAGIPVSNYFGRIEAGQAVLTLTGAGSEKFTSELEAQAEATGAAEEAFGTMADTLAFSMDSLKGKFQDLWLELGENVQPLLESIVDLLNMAADLAVPAFSGALEDMGESVAVVSDTLGYLMEALELFEPLLEMLGVKTEKATEKSDGFVKSLAKWSLRQNIPLLGGLIGLVGDLGRAMKGTEEETDGANEALEASKQKVADLQAGMASILETWGVSDLPNILGRLTTNSELTLAAFDRIGEAAKRNIPTVLGALQELSDSVSWQQVKGNLEEQRAATEVWTGQMTEMYANGQTALLSVVAELGPEKSALLLQQYGDDLDSLNSYLAEMVLAEMTARQQVRIIMAEEYLRQKGVSEEGIADIMAVYKDNLLLEEPTADALDRAAQAVEDNKDKVQEELTAMAAEANAEIKAQLGIGGEEAGRSLMDGLKDGFERGKASVTSALNKIGGGISSAFKSLFGISSPSKLFAEYGKDMMAGLALGLERSEPLAVQAMVGVGNSLMPESLGLAGGGSGTSISVTVPVTVTGGMTPEDGRRIGEEAGTVAAARLRSVLRLEAITA